MVKLDKQSRYREGGDILHGQYEQWSTCPICSFSFHGREPTVDFKDMALALKDTTGEGVTILGRMRNKKPERQASVNR